MRILATFLTQLAFSSAHAGKVERAKDSKITSMQLVDGVYVTTTIREAA